MTNEQLRNLRQAAKGGWKVELDGRGIRDVVAHIDAQAARIAELEAQAVNQQLTTEATGKDCLHVGVPDGWQRVPVQPTREMLVAINWPNDPAGYRAMLAAAPKPEDK